MTDSVKQSLDKAPLRAHHQDMNTPPLDPVIAALLAFPSEAEVAALLAAEVAAAPLPLPHKDRPCWKCGGSGKIVGYLHIEGGRCFACR